jgi:FkbH-like protein
VIDLLNLPWLPQKTPDATEVLDSRERLQQTALREIARFAQMKLHERDTRRLAKAARARAPDAADAGLVRIRLCLACQATADFLFDELIVAGLRFGLLLDIVETEFNQLADLAYGSFFEEQSHRGIDFTFVGLDYRQLGFRDDIAGDANAAEQEAAEKSSAIHTICAGIRAKTGAPCIIQNLVAQESTWLGSLDRNIPGSRQWLVDTVNTRLREHVAASPDYLFDCEHLAAQIGLANWHDPGMWYLAKLGFSQSAVPYFAHRLAALLAAAKGKGRRVLVLDLDNTLWGGVIGDDGVEGIRIGEGSALGEAFLDVHRMAKLLKSRGIVLAVSSKNDEAVAKLAFDLHSGMGLRLDDFAAFRANWDDKASNIRHIAQLLNLGLDSFVLLDDNPAEREIVRQTLPEVAVPEIGTDPAEYVRIAMAAGYFESVSFNAEDRQRAQMYRENAQRAGAMEIVADMAAYLASLEMQLGLRPFDKPGRGRIVQLINKSNQFNLTTRRYSAADVEALEADDSLFTLQASLKDRFGDNGMISVVICRPNAGDWEIDTWLMSCRVLKRRVEEQILQFVVDSARKAGAKRLKGIYRPTAKNGLVKNHYRDLGFEPGHSTGEEETWWLTIETTASLPRDLPFELV